jgi:hypothetical protein
MAARLAPLPRSARFDRDFAAYTQAGARFIRPAQLQPYDKVTVFEDL